MHHTIVTGVWILLAVLAVVASPVREEKAPAISIKRTSPPESVEKLLPQIRSSLNTKEIGILGAELRTMLQDQLAEELDRSQVNLGLLRVIVRSLAKLGDRNAEVLILAGLKSHNPVSRSWAMEDAAFARTPTLVAALGDMMFSDIPDQAYTPGEVYSAPSLVAVMLLATIVENPPTLKRRYTQEDVHIWREWWKSNRGIFVDVVYERSKEIVYPNLHQ